MIRAPGIRKIPMNFLAVVKQSFSTVSVTSSLSAVYHLGGGFRLAISTGRRNTLTKTLEDGVHADELKESSRFYRGLEGGVEGPLEASRGAKVEWASIWRILNRLFITSWPRTGRSRPQERGVMHVLRRPVEIAGV